MKTTGVFQFGKKTGNKVTVGTRPIDKEPKKTPETITPVQGQMPGSIQEWRVAKALDYYKMSYIFQYDVYGGKQVRGGQVIDFLVYTSPLPTPVYVQGEYWHRRQKATEDALKQAQVKNLFNGQINDPVLIWEHEVQTLEDAKHVVKEKIR